MPFQFALKLVAEAFHLFQGFGLHVAQHIPVEFQRVRSTQALPQLFAAFYVAFIKDVSSEAFHFVRDIPAFVVADALVDVVQQPCQYGRSGGELLDEAVYGITQHFTVVQLYVQVRTQLQFASKVTHHGLKKGVDGFHAETAVVMQHVLQCHAGPLADVLVRQFVSTLSLSF